MVAAGDDDDDDALAEDDADAESADGADDEVAAIGAPVVTFASWTDKSARPRVTSSGLGGADIVKRG